MQRRVEINCAVRADNRHRFSQAAVAVGGCILHRHRIGTGGEHHIVVVRAAAVVDPEFGDANGENAALGQTGELAQDDAAGIHIVDNRKAVAQGRCKAVDQPHVQRGVAQSDRAIGPCHLQLVVLGPGGQSADLHAEGIRRAQCHIAVDHHQPRRRTRRKRAGENHITGDIRVAGRTVPNCAVEMDAAAARVQMAGQIDDAGGANENGADQPNPPAGHHLTAHHQFQQIAVALDGYVLAARRGEGEGRGDQRHVRTAAVVGGCDVIAGGDRRRIAQSRGRGEGVGQRPGQSDVATCTHGEIARRPGKVGRAGGLGDDDTRAEGAAGDAGDGDADGDAVLELHAQGRR